jgi:hypothetical protein
MNGIVVYYSAFSNNSHCVHQIALSIPRFTALGTTHAKIAAMKNLPERHAFHIIRFQIKEFIHLSVDEYKSTLVIQNDLSNSAVLKQTIKKGILL